MLHLVFAILIIFAHSTIHTSSRCHEYMSQSFMFTHPVYMNVLLEQSLWHNIIYNKEGAWRASAQAIGMYQDSIADARIARYFLINHKNCLLVQGDAITCSERDVRAEWLGINNPEFSGFMSLNPQQTQYGAELQWHQDFSLFTDACWAQYCWFTALLPITHVANNITIMQWNVHNTGTGVAYDIISAFKQPDWCFAKMDGKQSVTTVPELTLKVGVTSLSQSHYQFIYYAGIRIPIANTQNPAFIFSPVAGNNGSVGFIGGINWQLLLNRNAEQIAFCFFLNLEATFYVPTHQLRTFDLIDKPWSRYLLFIKDGCPGSLIPGVNILTQKVKVQPFELVDFSLGWRCITEHMELEIGYGIWGHGDERLTLECPLEPIYGIAGTENNTASMSTIAFQAPNDPLFVPIFSSDLNLTSAASRSALNQRFSASIGYQNLARDIDTIVGIGAFYEWPQKNSALQLWGLWIKLGASF